MIAQPPAIHTQSIEAMSLINTDHGVSVPGSATDKRWSLLASLCQVVQSQSSPPRLNRNVNCPQAGHW